MAANGASFNTGQDVYVFAVAPSGATSVTFAIDGVVVKSDSTVPFDMVGSNSSGYANKYKLPDSPGSLTVTVETFFAQGPSTVTSATIFVH